MEFLLNRQLLIFWRFLTVTSEISTAKRIVAIPSLSMCPFRLLWAKYLESKYSKKAMRLSVILILFILWPQW